MFWNIMAKFMLVLMLVLSGTLASEAAEDCIPLNPNTANLAHVNNDWKIVDGSRWLFSFGSNQAEARQALAIIKKYNFSSSCFVGRPQPSFKYMKAPGAAPVSTATRIAPVTMTSAPNQPIQGPVATAPVDLKADRIWMARYVPPASLTQYTALTGNPKACDEVYLVCEFHNAGGDVRGDWRVSWQVDGKEVHSIRFGDFKAGARQSPAARYRIPDTGTHTYACALDPDRRIAERDVMNNRVAGTFQVTPASGGSQSAVPVLKTLNTPAALPGSALVVTGQNFCGIGSWRAVIELQGGQKFEQTPQFLSSTQFWVTVPDIYAGYNVTVKNAQHRERIKQVKNITLKQGTMMSNKLAFNIVSNYPIIDTLTKDLAYPGDIIFIPGGNVDMSRIAMYKAVFEYLPGKQTQTAIMGGNMPDWFPSSTGTVPYIPNISMFASFKLVVPDVFAGKSAAEQDAIERNMGKLYIFGPTGPAAVSNPLNIKISKRPATQPGSTTGSTTSASTCPKLKLFPGYNYEGPPSCSVHALGAYLICDAQGYVCCASRDGSRSQRCGVGKYEFPADCTRYFSGGGSSAGPMVHDGIFYGCYSRKAW